MQVKQRTLPKSLSCGKTFRGASALHTFDAVHHWWAFGQPICVVGSTPPPPFPCPLADPIQQFHPVSGIKAKLRADITYAAPLTSSPLVFGKSYKQLPVLRAWEYMAQSAAASCTQ